MCKSVFFISFQSLNSRSLLEVFEKNLNFTVLYVRTLFTSVCNSNPCRCFIDPLNCIHSTPQWRSKKLENSMKFFLVNSFVIANKIIFNQAFWRLLKNLQYPLLRKFRWNSTLNYHWQLLSSFDNLAYNLDPDTGLSDGIIERICKSIHWSDYKKSMQNYQHAKS